MGPITVQKRPFREIVTFCLVQNCAKEIAKLGDEKPIRIILKQELGCYYIRDEIITQQSIGEGGSTTKHIMMVKRGEL